MNIRFQTKKESNDQQEKDFLKLTGSQRFYAFLDLSYRLRNLPIKNKKEPDNNFLITINRG